MDWYYLHDKIYKVMANLSAINGEEYEDRFFNPHPYPGWFPQLKHYMCGHINTLKEKESKGEQLKADAESLSELFDIIISFSDSMEIKMNEGTERLGNAASKFNYLLLSNLNNHNIDNGEIKNIFISSGRLQAILSLISNWMDRKYRESIMKTICCEDVDIEEANEMFCDDRFLMPLQSKRYYVTKGRETIIDLNTFMWIQKGIKLDKCGVSDTEKAYNVHFDVIDFANTESAQSVINNQIAKSSHGLLKNVQVPISIYTNAILADILYFKSQWKKQFDEYNTRTRNFYYHGGVSKVKMMCQTDTFRYFENDIFQSIDLPYYGDSRTRDFSMWIHLPKRGHNITKVLEYISVNKVCSQYMEHEIQLTLPKFEVEMCTSIKDILSNLGMRDIFNDDNSIPYLLLNTKIDDVILQGKIKIDEHGTEASMVSLLNCETGCAPMERPKPIKMNVNHEFIFEIVENYTGQRFFSGIINKL